MIYLADMSDGETSDGGVSNSEADAPDVLNDSTGGGLCSNTNTLETMSAKSFGFVRPSSQQRQTDFAKRLRRHQSFLEPPTTSTMDHDRSSSRTTPPMKPARHQGRPML